MAAEEALRPGVDEGAQTVTCCGEMVEVVGILRGVRCDGGSVGGVVVKSTVGVMGGQEVVAYEVDELGREGGQAVSRRC